MKKILLDTNCYSGFMAGDEMVLDYLAQAETVYMSIIVLGELHAGFMGGSKARQNREYLTQFLAKPTVEILNATQETAEIFGEIKNRLREAGTPLPINDVWIAAHVIETGSIFITHDNHFKQIAGLRLWDIDF